MLVVDAAVEVDVKPVVAVGEGEVLVQAEVLGGVLGRVGSGEDAVVALVGTVERGHGAGDIALRVGQAGDVAHLVRVAHVGV